MGRPRLRLAPRAARGQALIEFAIVLLVLMALIVGGIELGTAALNSRSLRDGVQAAGDQWARDVQRHARSVNGALPLLYETCADQALVTAGSAPPGIACNELRLAGTPASQAPAYCGLGLHENPDAFGFPRCNDADCDAPEDGLPLHNDPDAGEHPARCAPVPHSPASHAAYLLEGDRYLFNPKPLDVTACAPGGALRSDCVSRLFDALPPLHRAIRSSYQLRCVDSLVALNEVLCEPGAVWLLRLPGRLHDDGVVRLAQAAASGAQLLSAGDPSETFAVQCRPPGTSSFAECEAPGACACDSRVNAQGVCWQAASPVPRPLACEARVIVRHRHLFFSAFPTGRFNDSAIRDAALLNDLDLGIQARGGLGAEVVSQGEDGNRSYFQVPWKTFKGCTEVLTDYSAAASAVEARRVSCN